MYYKNKKENWDIAWANYANIVFFYFEHIILPSDYRDKTERIENVEQRIDHIALHKNSKEHYNNIQLTKLVEKILWP